MLGHDRPARARRPLSVPAVGRPAAARGAGAGARDRAAGAAARRAAVGARREDPHLAAQGDPGDPAPARHHHDLRDPRPGGGAVAVRPGRGHERRPDRADRDAVRDLQLPAHARSWPRSWARSTWWTRASWMPRPDGCPWPGRRSAPRGPSRARRRATGSRSRSGRRGSTSATDPRGATGSAARSRTSTSSARSCACVSRSATAPTGTAPTTLALDTFNEPHLTLPAVGRADHRLVPARGVLRPRGDRRPHQAGAGGPGGRRDGVTSPLDGIDLVVFDKDGTLIDFHAMWSGWARDLAAGLEAATGRDLRVPLYRNLGYDDATGTGRRARPARGDPDGPHPRRDHGRSCSRRGSPRTMRRRRCWPPGTRRTRSSSRSRWRTWRRSSGRCGPPAAVWRSRPRTTADPPSARSPRRAWTASSMRSSARMTACP